MDFSVVIPVYNEAAILGSATRELLENLKTYFPDQHYELLLVENGSSDATPTLVDELAQTFPEVRALHCPHPDYGAALKLGIRSARGRFVLGDEIDLGDMAFYTKALHLLQEGLAQLVIGSKVLKGSGDRRPLVRRLATKGVNLLLRVVLGFRGSDTHGLKAFHRETLIPIVESCVIGKDLFASELVIRAQRGGVDLLEIPISLQEKRPPAINLFRRVPGVLSGLLTLYRVLGRE